uniref:Uncharacterized protein n=1 Tax=Zea mays TaxID=4577 RepID=B4F9D0_MAIZE|nr:unknown [Zea mays]
MTKTQRLHQLDGPMEHQRHQQKSSNHIMLLLLEVKIELLLFGRQRVPVHYLLLGIFSLKVWLIYLGALMVIHFLPAPWMDQLQTFTLK